MTTNRQAAAIIKKQLAHRELLWPNAEPNLWNRKVGKGFATIPKTMPIILQIMDGLSNGKPLSPTYMALWCDTWDNSMVNLSRPQEMAHAAGFTGERAVYTWKGRMKRLQELSFIDIKPGKSGEMSHVIIWNPHRVILEHQARKTPGLVEANFNAFLERALEVGAKDVLDAGSTVPAPDPSLDFTALAASVPHPIDTPNAS